MVFEFVNLSQEEIDSLYAFENDHPDCSVKETRVSFDGTTAVQLLTPENIASAAQVLTALIGMVVSIAVAKSSADASIKAAEISAKASLETARINAEATRDAAKINADAAKESKKVAAEEQGADTEKAPNHTKEIYVQLSNGEKKLIPAGATIKQIKEIIGYSEETEEKKEL